MKINLTSVKLKKGWITAVIILALCVVAVIYLASQFTQMWEADTFYPGEGVTEQKMLSDYYAELKDTAGDTPIYILDSGVEGATMLVLGGTHANEPSGVLSATYLLENCVPKAGRLIVIPETNAAGFTCTDPQEASPMFYEIETPTGTRTFRYGSRATNPIYQWPDADIYVHASSGQTLSGAETRNINRTYPGRTDGTFTEKVSYAVTTLINEEKVEVTIDLHEASPEYITVNAIVAHQDAIELSQWAKAFYLDDYYSISVEPSAVNFHGLTHRELGDYTDTLAILMETANPSQGRLHGATSSDLVTTGSDKFYDRAYKAGRLSTAILSYDEETGESLALRSARHITAINSFAQSYVDCGLGTLDLGDIASFEELSTNLYNYLAIK